MLKDVGVSFNDELATAGPPAGRPLLVCFSHLRWDFVFQRPQHLMSRFAASHDVRVWEEPVFLPAPAAPRVEARTVAPNLTIATPQLVEGMAEELVEAALCALLDDYLGTDQPQVAWYYTPMMLPFSRHLRADCTVYDCMDELANFRFAPPRLLELEAELFERADLVFTGGYSLYEAKRSRHPSVHPFPSSVDIAHFAQARATPPANERPTLGFYGVLDERFDIDLLAAIADARPGWRFEMVGPIVKISPDELPKRDNIAYPGPATYDQLPGVLAGWDVALMPFAINDATRFISPTKTPEYLAAGKPVVSTPVRDVIRHYGRLQGVKIAATADEFVAGCEAALALASSDGDWLGEVDQALSSMSWNTTQRRMAGLIAEVTGANEEAAAMAGAVA
jgi:UDP-galactopyranose mutase